MTTFERVPDEFRYPYLSPAELKARLDRKAILYLPIGSLEWHNEHLPLGTDTLHALALAERLCRRIGGVALPGFWWNTGGAHDWFCTYHMPEDLYRPALKSIILGLKPVPAKLLVLINGHGGRYQYDTPPILADELNREGFPMHVLVADPYYLGQSSPTRIDHADTGETSLSMELIPQLVRLDRPLVPDIRSGRTPFAAKGPPSAEKGRQLWDAFFADATALIEAEYARP